MTGWREAESATPPPLHHQSPEPGTGCIPHHISFTPTANQHSHGGIPLHANPESHSVLTHSVPTCDVLQVKVIKLHLYRLPWQILQLLLVLDIEEEQLDIVIFMVTFVKPAYVLVIRDNIAVKINNCFDTRLVAEEG